MKSCEIVLVSASPRRAELLRRIAENFEVRPADVPELRSHPRPSFLVRRNALNKALSGAEPGKIVIAADTVVHMDGRYFLKPRTEEEAVSMLETLSGRTHSVYTGVCVLSGKERFVFYERSLVRLKRLTKEEIRAYVSTGSPMDKAGAYGIQDGVVESLSGSRSNVMGLPVERLKAVLDAISGGGHEH